MKTVTLKDVPEIASELIKQMKAYTIFTFSGPLGAGKTTLVQEILKQLGVTGPVQSPTYTYMSVYRLPDGRTFYHFDLYRLNSLDDFLTEGFDEYFLKKNSWCFIEWPEILDPILKNTALPITLEYGDNNTRLITVKKGDNEL